MGMMKRSFWVFSAVGFNLWRFIRVHGATFAAFIATLQCLLMGPLVNEMLCLRDDLYTWEINHCLSVEQYTSVYSVEVVMYCLFNARLKKTYILNPLRGQMMQWALQILWNKHYTAFTTHFTWIIGHNSGQSGQNFWLTAVLYTSNFLINDLLQTIFNHLEIFLHPSSALCLLITFRGVV